MSEKHMTDFVHSVCGWMSIVFIALSLTAIGRSFVSIYFTRYVTDSAMALLQNGMDWEAAKRMILIFGLLMVIFDLLSAAKEIVFEKISLKARHDFEEEINRHVSRIHPEQFEYYQNNVNIKEVSENGANACLNIYRYMVSIICAVPAFCVYFYYLFKINFIVAALYLAITAFLVRISDRLFGNLGEMKKEIWPHMQRQRYFFSLFCQKNSHQECRALRLGAFLSGKWNSAFEEENVIKIRVLKKLEVRLQTIRFIFNLPYFFMLAYTAYEVSCGAYTVGFLVMMNELLNSIIDSMEGIQDDLSKYKMEKVYILKYKEVMDLKECAHENAQKHSDGIFVQNLCYQYPQAQIKALDQINLQIRRGEKIALVGKNGSGKSTFVNILLGNLAGYEGSISWSSSENISGNSHQAVLGSRDCKSLNGSTAFILQDFSQYQMSIRDNIQVGCIAQKLSDEELYDILELVGLGETVKNLPQKLDTVLGTLEKGTDFSKGQWQRIAVARLLANKQADIWILDEPTAFLDPLAEIDIYNLVRELGKDKTVIFISHRLGFSKYTDRIILFNDGKVEEDGTFQELMDSCGTFAEMYRAQASWY